MSVPSPKRVRLRPGPIISLLAAAVLAGCSVVPLPKALAGRDQSPREQQWDIADCRAEMGYQTGYSAQDSPLANWFQKLFFWGTVGAATGGTIMLFPAAAGVTVTGSTLMSSPIGEALVAGAGAGAITGTMLSWSGQERFERAFMVCMESRGYTIVSRDHP
jgi:hypothetical protein